MAKMVVGKDMTKSQAADALKAAHTNMVAEIKKYTALSDYKSVGALMYYAKAHEIAINALKGPQPDPETGLVPCGCGGHGLCYFVASPYQDKGYSIVCSDCHIKVEGCIDAISAKECWNTALGYREVE